MKILKQIAVAILICSGVATIAMERRIQRRSERPTVAPSIMDDILAKKAELEKIEGNNNGEVKKQGGIAQCKQKWEKILNQENIKGAAVAIYEEEIGGYQMNGYNHIAYIYDAKKYNPNKIWENKLCKAHIYLFLVYAINKLLSAEDKLLLEQNYDKPISQWPAELQQKLTSAVMDSLSKMTDPERASVLEHMIACENI